MQWRFFTSYPFAHHFSDWLTNWERPGSPHLIADSPLGSTHWDLLLQFGVLGFGLDKDGDVGVRIFPEGEEILIRGTCFDRVPTHRVSTRQAEAGQRSPWEVHHQSSVVDELLKFRCRSRCRRAA